jgi:sulfate-transporting ATPase
MNRVSKTVPPKRQILKDISLSFFPGAKIGVLGLNGSGKSSLLKIMAGVDKEIEGEAIPMPACPSATCPRSLSSTRAHRAPGRGRSHGRGEQRQGPLEEVYAAYAEKMPTLTPWLPSRRAGSHHRRRRHGLRAPAGNRRRRAAPAGLGRQVGQLSGGEKRRVALCKLLLSKPDMLLLDEPTNHLDAESVDWLEQFLHRFSGTVVAITHDRYFLDNAAEWILELDRGHGIPYKGNYSDWLTRRATAWKPNKRAKKPAPRPEEGTGMGAPERQGPPGQVQGPYCPLRGAERLRIPAAQRNAGNLHSCGRAPGLQGHRVQQRLQVLWRPLLIDNLSMNIPAGAIVGIIGPNGAGKSTLFKLIAGKEQPDSGTVDIGQTVKMAFVDQHRDALANDKTVWEDISGGLDIINVGKFRWPRAYAGRFNFNGQDQQKKVGNLSGGERGRLHLAKTLIQGGNVLLLDEPSNDLDVETLRALEDALLEYAGTVMVISHDRWFLDRIATHILAAEGDSQWVFFDGNYQEYEADKKKRLGEEGASPSACATRPQVILVVRKKAPSGAFFMGDKVQQDRRARGRALGAASARRGFCRWRDRALPAQGQIPVPRRRRPPRFAGYRGPGGGNTQPRRTVLASSGDSPHARFFFLPLSRRGIARAAAALLATCALGAGAQTAYPNKPVRVVVGWPAAPPTWWRASWPRS